MIHSCPPRSHTPGLDQCSVCGDYIDTYGDPDIVRGAVGRIACVVHFDEENRGDTTCVECLDELVPAKPYEEWEGDKCCPTCNPESVA